MKTLRPLIFVLCLLALGARAEPVIQEPKAFTTTITRDVNLGYLLYLPDGYEDSEEKWPLILFLHGSGERGSDIEAVKANGIAKNLDAGTNLPFIVVSPQCPRNTSWQDSLMVEALNSLLDDVIARYRVDEERVYLTGLSMGGHGTWALAGEYPDRFAAIAPVCGAGEADYAPALRRLPIWVFHGALDDVVDPGESEYMVDALKKCDGNVEFTLYPDANHNSWTVTYNNPELYEWFLSHTRPARPVYLDLSSAIATASSGEAEKAIDGDPGTRWETLWSDPQRLEIDLGKTTRLRQMTIQWEYAYSSAYDVLASDDGENWKTVFSREDADGVVDVIGFPEDTAARYIRLDCKARGTEYGHSIWEITLE